MAERTGGSPSGTPPEHDVEQDFSVPEDADVESGSSEDNGDEARGA